jgi:DNA-directed RNA polymerase III subunit RPC2
MLCPADTPAGEACGLVKNLALMTHITTDEEEGPIAQVAYALGVEAATLVSGAELHDSNSAMVFLNGTIIGIHRRPLRFAKQLRMLRRAGHLGEFVSVYVIQNTLHIASDGGRVCRPLIICDNGVPRVKEAHIEALKATEMNFTSFLRAGLIEYLDVNEENNSLVALYESYCGPNTTHLEIEPFTILGVCAGLIPYPHHNQVICRAPSPPSCLSRAPVTRVQLHPPSLEGKTNARRLLREASAGTGNSLSSWRLTRTLRLVFYPLI